MLSPGTKWLATGTARSVGGIVNLDESMRDPYDVLGIRSTATEAELKSAYRLLAKRFHPDADPGNTALAERFKEVTAAYEFLKDPIKRSRFDRGEIDATGAYRRRASRSYGRDRRSAAGNHRSQTAAESATRNGARNGNASGPPRSSGSAQSGASTRSAAGSGGQSWAGRDRKHRTGASDSAGATDIPGDEHRETEEAVRSRYHEIFADFFNGVRDRPNDRGAGLDQIYRISVTFEESALGAKRRVRLAGERTVEVSIPAGIRDGQQIRLKGMGRTNGTTVGDALLRLDITDHPFYRREDNDVHVTLPVTLIEAVLGAKVMVPTLHGVVHLTIPPGANTGTTLRLRGRGIQPEKTAAPGDQLVTLQIVLPDDPPKDFVKTVKKWAEKWPGGSVRGHMGLEK
ncbi:MAG: DnaJ C-terminal domain-containing protein [Alphaproteobacteria bacterium]